MLKWTVRTAVTESMGYTPKKHKEIKLKLKYSSCQTWEDLKYEVPFLLQENAFDA